MAQGVSTDVAGVSDLQKLHAVLSSSSDRAAVLASVDKERVRQLLKWGPQTHPDFLPHEQGAELDRAKWAEQAAYYKQVNDFRVAQGLPAIWAFVLLEELFEALESDAGSVELETELVETAAVCAAWVEDIRSRRARHQD